MMTDIDIASRQTDNSLRTAYVKAAEILKNCNPEKICDKTGVLFRESMFVVEFLGIEYEIRMPDVLFSDSDTLLILQVMILHYLTGDEQYEIKDGFINFQGIPGAMFYFHAFKQRVLNKLIGIIGSHQDRLLSAIGKMGGSSWKGDKYSGEIPLFPRIEMVIQYYPADEEFPAGANILFPDNIAAFLPVEDIVFLSGYVVNRLGKALS